MSKKATGTMLTLLLMGTFVLTTSLMIFTLEVQPVKASLTGYITILPNGTVVGQPSELIHQNEDNYTYSQTSDISYYGIVIERDNMTLDGNTHSITGDGSCVGIGVNVTGRSHVMLKRLKIYSFQHEVEFNNSNYCQLYQSIVSGGNRFDDLSAWIYVMNSAHVTLYSCNATSHRHGIEMRNSSFNMIFNCTIFNNYGLDRIGQQIYYNEGWGIDINSSSSFNEVFDNWVGSNHDGIGIEDYSFNNSFTNNIITGNGYLDYPGEGLGLYDSANNSATRNDFSDNNQQVNIVGQSYNNSWDGGHPSNTSGGNNWTDYKGNDTDGDGIGDTPYNITVNNLDNYPLMQYNYTYRFLNITLEGNGATDPVPETYPYPYPGMNITVTATPNPNNVFDHWVLDGTTNKYDNPTTIAMDNNHTLKAYFTVAGGGGCPYVVAWNGSSYVLDNNILPASETGNGTDVKDYYLLQQPLVPVSSTEQTSLYSLKIGEFENEQDHIDQVNLMAVDHSQNTSIAVTPEGEIVTYTNPAAPLSCVDDNGTNRLSEVSSMDGNVSDPSTYYQGYNGNWLVLDFGSVNASNANLILRDDQKCAEVCIDVQVPDLNGSWQTVEVLHPRDYWSMEAVNMTAHIPASGDFIVRLLWTATHRLDYVGLDTSSQAQITVNAASPLSAVHSTQGDVTAKLLYDDEDCVELVNGQQITLDFTLPNCPQDSVRDFIFYTDGYYYTISP